MDFIVSQVQEQYTPGAGKSQGGTWEIPSGGGSSPQGRLRVSALPRGVPRKGDGPSVRPGKPAAPNEQARPAASVFSESLLQFPSKRSTMEIGNIKRQAAGCRSTLRPCTSASPLSTAVSTAPHTYYTPFHLHLQEVCTICICKGYDKTVRLLLRRAELDEWFRTRPAICFRRTPDGGGFPFLLSHQQSLIMSLPRRREFRPPEQTKKERSGYSPDLPFSFLPDPRAASAGRRAGAGTGPPGPGGSKLLVKAGQCPRSKATTTRRLGSVPVE